MNANCLEPLSSERRTRRRRRASSSLSCEYPFSHFFFFFFLIFLFYRSYRALSQRSSAISFAISSRRSRRWPSLTKVADAYLALGSLKEFGLWYSDVSRWPFCSDGILGKSFRLLDSTDGTLPRLPWWWLAAVGSTFATLPLEGYCSVDGTLLRHAATAGYCSVDGTLVSVLVGYFSEEDGTLVRVATGSYRSPEEALLSTPCCAYFSSDATRTSVPPLVDDGGGGGYGCSVDGTRFRFAAVAYCSADDTLVILAYCSTETVLVRVPPAALDAAACCSVDGILVRVPRLLAEQLVVIIEVPAKATERRFGL